MVLGVSASVLGADQWLLLQWLLSSAKGSCGTKVGGKWFDMVMVIEDTMSRNNKCPGHLQNLKTGTYYALRGTGLIYKTSNYGL